jgi:hypothetical protein
MIYRMVSCVLTCAMGLALFGSMGCQERLGNFTFLASKNLDLTNLNTEASENSPAVIGEDKKQIIIVASTGRPDLEEAADRAIEQGKSGVGLTNAVVYYDWWYIPYIVGEMKFTVKGNVVPRANP